MAKGKSHISSKKSNRCDFPFKFVNRNQPGLSMKWETQCAHRSVQTSAPPCTGIFAFLHFALLHRNFFSFAFCIVAQTFLHICIFAHCIVAQKSFAFVHFCTGFFAFLHWIFCIFSLCIVVQAFSHFCTLHCCTGILHCCIFALCIVAQAFLQFCIVAQEFLHFCILHCCSGIFAHHLPRYDFLRNKTASFHCQN